MTSIILDCLVHVYGCTIGLKHNRCPHTTVFRYTSDNFFTSCTLYRRHDIIIIIIIVTAISNNAVNTIEK